MYFSRSWIGAAGGAAHDGVTSTRRSWYAGSANGLLGLSLALNNKAHPGLHLVHCSRMKSRTTSALRGTCSAESAHAAAAKAILRSPPDIGGSCGALRALISDEPVSTEVAAVMVDGGVKFK